MLAETEAFLNEALDWDNLLPLRSFTPKLITKVICSYWMNGREGKMI